MLFIGADHRGFVLKEELKKYLLRKRISFTDLGNFKFEKEDDYPIAAALVAEQVSTGRNNIGILLCGSGVGVCMVANKFKNVRAGLVWDAVIAKTAKADDNINIICLPADYLTLQGAQKVIDTWLKTPFKKEAKYKHRLNLVQQIEKNLN